MLNYQLSNFRFNKYEKKHKNVLFVVVQKQLKEELKETSKPMNARIVKRDLAVKEETKLI